MYRIFQTKDGIRVVRGAVGVDKTDVHHEIGRAGDFASVLRYFEKNFWANELPVDFVNADKKDYADLQAFFKRDCGETLAEVAAHGELERVMSAEERRIGTRAINAEAPVIVQRRRNSYELATV